MTKRSILGVCLVLLLTGACAPHSYFGVKNQALYVPGYFQETQDAIASAEKSAGAQYCPEMIAKANELAKQGAETYWSCHTEEAKNLLAQARQTAKDAESCQPPPAPAAAPVEKEVLDSDNDGVLDDVDKCPNTPPKILVDETGCTVGKKSIFFEFDSAKLTTTSRENMAGVADIFKNAVAKSPTARVEIQGHTDSKGSAAYNQKLSLRRAEAVKEYLVSQGVPASMLSTKGFGAAQPVAPNTTEQGRAMNRRIDFVIVSQ